MEKSIRISVKGILVRNGCILLNRCHDEFTDEYYTLPGGGLQRYETLEEALMREMREETGWAIERLQFAGLYEEIQDDISLRERRPEYCHQIYHIFLCHPCDRENKSPLQMDSSQICSEWLPIESLHEKLMLPLPLAHHMQDILAGKGPLFLGSWHISNPHMEKTDQ